MIALMNLSSFTFRSFHPFFTTLWIFVVLVSTVECSGKDPSFVVDLKDYYASWRQLSKDLEAVKTAEDFSTATNKLCDSADKYNNSIKAQLKLSVSELKAFEESLKNIKVDPPPAEDLQATDIASANLAQKFNTSPRAVKARNRQLACMEEMRKLGEQVGKLSAEANAKK